MTFSLLFPLSNRGFAVFGVLEFSLVLNRKCKVRDSQMLLTDYDMSIVGNIKLDTPGDETDLKKNKHFM